MHVHVHSPRGEAKFWLEPRLELAHNHGLTLQDINVAFRRVAEHENEIRKSWEAHFGG